MIVFSKFREYLESSEVLAARAQLRFDEIRRIAESARDAEPSKGVTDRLIANGLAAWLDVWDFWAAFMPQGDRLPTLKIAFEGKTKDSTHHGRVLVKPLGPNVDLECTAISHKLDPTLTLPLDDKKVHQPELLSAECISLALAVPGGSKSGEYRGLIFEKHQAKLIAEVIVLIL